mmetsp:Transcript_21857/g.46687  ORF Transcript_21857/g.46687 Transcript_21857/m.46687 type:complete len:271 (+) Transcript_21857:1102-1914(+)
MRRKDKGCFGPKRTTARDMPSNSTGLTQMLYLDGGQAWTRIVETCRKHSNRHSRSTVGMDVYSELLTAFPHCGQDALNWAKCTAMPASTSVKHCSCTRAASVPAFKCGAKAIPALPMASSSPKLFQGQSRPRFTSKEWAIQVSNLLIRTGRFADTAIDESGPGCGVWPATAMAAMPQFRAPGGTPPACTKGIRGWEKSPGCLLAGRFNFKTVRTACSAASHACCTSSGRSPDNGPKADLRAKTAAFAQKSAFSLKCREVYAADKFIKIAG